MILLREYQSKDFELLLKFIEDLTDHIVSVDNLKRQRRMPSYAARYTKYLIKKIKENKGVIYLAEDNNVSIGFVAGIVQKQKKEELLEVIPTKCGRILDLYVDSNNRSKGVGKILMRAIESYLKKEKCDIIKVDVFAPNDRAYKFYQNLGYKNRSFDLIKVMK